MVLVSDAPPADPQAATRPGSTSASRPHPPGDYPVVVVGSGPGAIQVSYSLGRLGVRHALLSADPVAGGMFRRFPFFQRLLSWTKLDAPYPRGSRPYEWYDWNSLLGEEPSHRAIMPELMDGTSEFPSRPEMERGIATFVERTGLQVRYGTPWVGTRRDGERFVIQTPDGDYRCTVAIFAVGVAEPWMPPTPGIEHARHYVDTREPDSYAGKRLFIVGKQNSAFELASGLLHRASRIVLASPRPTVLSVNTHSLLGVRARYVQPKEDAILGGGVFLLDASVERIERTERCLVVHTRSTATSTALPIEADEVIAATGFTAPLRDLTALGVSVFGQSRLPTMTNFWESATVPGIYFAGTIGQGVAGLRKYGLPANSGAVHGARYNARILARYVAERHFGVAPERPMIRPADAVNYLLEEATTAPELWNQKSYLCRVLVRDEGGGLRDDGILPLAWFVDSDGPDAVAMTVETDDTGDIHPAVYVRRDGRTDAGTELPSHPLHEFRTSDHRRALAVRLGGTSRAEGGASR